MNNSVTNRKGAAMEVIPQDQWITFLADFTRRNRGAHARLEIMNLEAGDNVVAENRQLDGVAADTKDGEHNVWITFSDSPGQLTHGVHDAAVLYALAPSESSGEILTVESRDGSKTVLYLSKSGQFALPGPNPQGRG